MAIALAALSAGAALAAGSLGILAYSYLVEPRAVELERLTLRIPNSAGRLPPDGLRILHLSDTHFQGTPRKQRREQAKIKRILKLTKGLDFDLLVHTGDFIHYDSGLAQSMTLLDALPAPRLGKFAVLGNHDYAYYHMQSAAPRMWANFRRREQVRGRPAWTLPFRLPAFIKYVRNTPLDGRRSGYNDALGLTRALEQRGYQVMSNRALRLVDRQRGVDLWLAGVDDVTEGRPRLGETVAAIPPSEPLVLLSHNPDILASPQIPRIDVVLAGHTHGGQIVVPLWGPAHTQSWHLKRSEVSGYMQRGRTHVYITRGIGEGIPLRFNAPPQIALITLLPE